MYYILGLGGYAEVMLDLHFFEEVVEAAAENVAKQDVGWLEHRHYGSGLVHGVEANLGTQSTGLACTKTRAQPEDQGVVVFNKLFLSGEEGGGYSFPVLRL
jgi:hypothetical protein